ncbi:MAG: hypothetical protein D4S01_04695 [Dehalococcoidia bacterium]|nr:MAG: hypothetical protein D4S01_04695 [Dehalococcoidia bacterium]
MLKLELSALKSLKIKERILLILMVTILIWGGYYRKIHRPNVSRIKDLRSQVREVQDKIFKLEDQIPPSYLKLEKKLENIKQDYNALEEKLDTFYGEMAKGDQMSELLKYLTIKDISLKNELEFIFVKAEPLEEKKFYQKLPLKVSLTGDYNRIISYLKRLEYLSRFVKVTDLQLQADPDILPVLNVHLSLAALLQKPEEKRPSIFGQRLAKVDLKTFQATKWTDPFTASIPEYLMLEKGSELPQVKDLTLSGVIWLGDVPSAIISGDAVKVGDDIEGLEVLEILKDCVILERRGERVKLKLKSTY